MSDATFGGDPAQGLHDRWRRGKRPDVGAFLANLGGLSPTGLAARAFAASNSAITWVRSAVRSSIRSKYTLGSSALAAFFFSDSILLLVAVNLPLQVSVSSPEGAALPVTSFTFSSFTSSSTARSATRYGNKVNFAPGFLRTAPLSTKYGNPRTP